jgi:putative ABC transport system ATP-binding protein
VTGIVLAAREVVKQYERTVALRGVSLSVDRGEIVAVTGPSGCGKSTLLHCLAGILLADAGVVVYGDHALGSLSEAHRARLRRTQFGVLFQFGQVVPELTALENVTLPLQLSGIPFRRAAVTAQEWLDRLGIGELSGSRPGMMSGGQQQRVAMARALVTQPAVVFADEPTGALDSVTGDQVLAELVGLSREQSTAVVLVTHDARVAAHADREVTMLDGLVDTDDRFAAPGGPR